MAEIDTSKLRCPICDSQGFYPDDDGHYYCFNCNSQADDIIETGNADEDFVDKGGAALYSAAHKRRVSLSAVKSEPIDAADHVGPTEPADFGTVPKGVVVNEEDYYKAVRMRYVMGLQLMIQLQCEALVERFGVSPLVCGIAGSVWVRFVASTRIFDDGWADKTMLESESRGERKYRPGITYAREPRNIYNERMVTIWCKCLKKTIPLSCSLAVSYLACHIAREAVLPTDIVRWSIEGKLPYFGVFPKIAESIKKIEKHNQHVSIICPKKASSMFRPSHAVPLQKLESMAASIAKSTGLILPPVNFYGIASRYLKQLSLPVEKIIPYACRIQEWSMPPGLWLSASELRLPTRVCVMSILIVAIRILYNINGFGKWETTLSAPVGSSSMDEPVAESEEAETKDDAEEMSTFQRLNGEPGASLPSVHKFESDGAELLRELEKRYDDLNDKFEYSKDLPTYLQYCKDVVFAGLEPLYKDPSLIEELWDFYQKNREDTETPGKLDTGRNQKRSRNSQKSYGIPPKESKKHRDEETTGSLSSDTGSLSKDDCPEWCPSDNDAQQSSPAYQTSETTGKDESSQNLRDISIRHMKIDMEEHRFCYIPPRVKVKERSYLHYARKKDSGFFAHVAHADYYIVLRACAKVAQVDIRVMHAGVLSLERRLAWIEKMIDHSLQETRSNDPGKSSNDLTDEFVNLSNLNL